MFLDSGDVDQAPRPARTDQERRSRNERAVEELRELMLLLQSYS
jgi:hypothetical protein